jgi:hypothetical protein
MAFVKRLPIFLALWACNVAICAAQDRGATTHDSAGIRIVDNASPLWTARTLNQIPALTLGVNGDAAEQFGKVVGAVRLSDGSVVVADGKNAELRLFSAAGKFIRKIGQTGEGPGDFRGLWSIFRQAGDTVVAWDLRLHRLTGFTADGKVRRTIAVGHPPTIPGPRGGAIPNLTVIGPLQDGSVMASHRSFRINPPTGNYSDSLFVVHVSADGKPVPIVTLFLGESYVFFSADNKMMTGDDRPLSAKSSVATEPEGLWYTGGVRYELRDYDMKGKLRRIVRVRHPLTPVTRADIAAFGARAMEEVKHEKFRDESLRQPAIDLQQSLQKWLSFPATMPAFTALKVDVNGNVWAREYGDSTKVQHWDAFDRSGRLLGVVDMPAGLDVLEIGTDYVLGRLRDQDDVDSVRLYRFTR